MCGIAGFCNMPERWEENIKGMDNRMITRGPDAEGIWANEDKSVVLGHRRLAIIDLSENGAQPMVSSSERFVIALNGEIYNFKELRKKLLAEKKVFGFKGNCDTEVLLELIEAYGLTASLTMVKGMYAFALFDRKTQKLYLVRDRIGEKPLYYGFINQKFVFASDLGAIKENLYFDGELDLDALSLYFRHGYIPAPYTIYKNIRKVEAGSIIELNKPYTDFSETTYWDIKEIALRGQKNRFRGSEEEAAEQLESLLANSIKMQMVADVPVGAFLSGGIDSATVVSVMQQLSTRKIKTFTIGFKNNAYNEAEYAQDIAKYLGTEHTELYITENEAIKVIPQLPHIYAEPFADSSQIPTYLVSKVAKENVTVALTGDGGDELFCGYRSYQKIGKVWDCIRPIPQAIRYMAKQAIGTLPLGNATQLRKIAYCIDADSCAKLYELRTEALDNIDRLVLHGHIPEYKFNQYEGNTLKNGKEDLMLMDLLMYHPDDILVKVDRAGMAVSLETRIPLLDRDIVEFTWQLPLAYKADNHSTKKVLRRILYKYIPKEIMERPKKGFSVPIDEWLKKRELREWAQELLNPLKIKQQGILNEKMVSSYWTTFIKNGIWNIRLWYLLMFQEWFQEQNSKIKM